MRSRVIFSVALIAALGAGLAEARPGERLLQRLGGPMPAPPVLAAAPQTISYGSDPLQQLDLYQAGGVRNPAPLVLFVHGGGWRRGSKDHPGGAWKAVHYT